MWVTRGSPIGFFYPVIPTQNVGQSRNPEGYFWHPTSRAYFQSRISPRFRLKIPNPESQIREIPHPEKLIGDPLIQVIEINILTKEFDRETASLRSKRFRARKVGTRAKKGMTGEGEGKEGTSSSPLPLPRHSFFCSRPNFSG